MRSLKQSSWIFLIYCAAVVFSWSFARSDGDEFIIHGRVVDIQGRPIAGARIFVSRMNGAINRNLLQLEERTNADGEWRWNLKKSPSVVDLRAVAEGYVPKSFSIESTKEDPILVLEKARSIFGIVQDRDGVAVADVTVAAVEFAEEKSDVLMNIRTMQNTVQSGPVGEFVCKDFLRDFATLYARKEDGSSGLLSRVDARVDVQHAIMLSPPTTITLEVTDQNGRPLEDAIAHWIAWGATVPMDPWHAFTGADGKVTWDKAPQGRIWLTIEYPQLRPKHILIDTSSVEERVQKIALLPVHQLHVNVVDKTTGEPIHNFRLQVDYTRKLFHLSPGESFPMADGKPGDLTFRGTYNIQGKNGTTNVSSNLDFDVLNFSVAAAGYKTSGKLSVPSAQVSSEMTIELEPLSGDVAVLRDPSGNIAEGAILTYAPRFNRSFEFSERLRALRDMPINNDGNSRNQITDEQGQFLLNWDTNHKLYLIWHENGWAGGTVDSLAGKKFVDLLPWGEASIQGMTETQWASGNVIVCVRVPSLEIEKFPQYLEIPLQQFPFDSEIDLTRVPTGAAQLMEKKKRDSTVWYETIVPYDVKANETVKVSTRGTATVEGSIEFRGDVPTTPPTPKSLVLKLKRIDEQANVPPLYVTDIQPDGSFIFENLLAGRYAIQIERLDRTRPVPQGSPTDPYGYLNSSMTMEKVIEIQEGEHRTGETATVYMFKNQTAGSNPKGLPPRFAESTDSFVSSEPPRFLVKTKPPVWFQATESSPSEKIVLISESGKPIREFGIEEIRSSYILEPLVDMHHKLFWLRLDGKWNQFDFSGRRRGSISSGIILDKRSGKTWFASENRYWEFKAEDHSVLQTKYEGVGLFLADDQSVWTSDPIKGVQRYGSDGSLKTTSLGKNGRFVQSFCYDPFRNGCWLQIRGSSVKMNGVFMNTEVLFISDAMEVKNFPLADGRVKAIFPTKDNVVVHFMEENTQDVFFKIGWENGQVEGFQDDTEKYLYVADPDGKTHWRRNRDGLEQIEILDGAVTVLKEVKGIPDGTVYVLPAQ